MTEDELHDKIATWHEAPSDSYAAQMEIHEYLGWTWTEYKRWLETNEMPG